jgi:phosphoglycolate phosphatase
VSNGSAVVGFDLDMTLIDSREAILAAFAAVARETGVTIDPAGVESRLGVKLQDEFVHWFPAGQVESAITIYRRHYPGLSRAMTTALPGARESLAAVRLVGGRPVVVTAKLEETARRSLDDVGLAVEEVFGGVHGPEKGDVLAALAAAVYVGDTPADMAAGVQAGAYPVGVITGSFTGSELQAAGAAIVLSTLTQFPAWYAGYRAA